MFRRLMWIDGRGPCLFFKSCSSQFVLGDFELPRHQARKHLEHYDSRRGIQSSTYEVSFIVYTTVLLMYIEGGHPDSQQV
jgi:hypothetical protein